MPIVVGTPIRHARTRGYNLRSIHAQLVVEDSRYIHINDRLWQLGSRFASHVYRMWVVCFLW